MHCVFSTKNRTPMIIPELQQSLWPYIGGIARANKMKALAVGGMPDHVHTLLSIPATIPVAKAVQLIKGGSSKWIHDTFPRMRAFTWQEGYGAFSIGVSAIEDTVAYINQQENHHKRRTFEEEFVAFLERHGIEYDPRYVWG